MLIAHFCFANMASPIWQGTKSGTVFSSKDVDILKERIHVTINKDFQTANYKIEYFISSDMEGNQIPLLFHAEDYKDEFRVWIDNKRVSLSYLPTFYKATKDSLVKQFSSSFRNSSTADEPQVSIMWSEHEGSTYDYKDLKYFEIDLSKGEHIIRVEYVADVWTDNSDWVKEYNFNYSLSPARFWRSFGSLEVTVKCPEFNQLIKTNLGQPKIKSSDSLYWQLKKLPADFFTIAYIPNISNFSKMLIKIGPIGLTVIFALLIIFLHSYHIFIYRKSHLEVKYSWVVIAGSIINPLVILIGYMSSYSLIESSIGKDAGSPGGYLFLCILLYPIALPIYWLLMGDIDRKIKKNRNKKQSNS
jgi:hypothetical protein